MKKSFSKFFLAPLTVLVLASFALAPITVAAAVTAAVVVTSAVVGSMVRTVPAGCVPVNYGGMIYQQCGSTWYQPQGSQYIVINPPY